MKRKLSKALSVILCVVFVFQAVQVGAFGAVNKVTFNNVSSGGNIGETLGSTISVYSGSHKLAVGRAGTFAFNDYTLVQDGKISVSALDVNIYPADITLRYNSHEYRFLHNSCGETSEPYGKDMFFSAGSSVYEAEYTDKTLLLMFDGAGSVEILRAAEDGDDVGAVPDGCTAWVSDGEFAGTVLFKSTDTDAPFGYMFNSAENEITYFDRFGRLVKRENSAADVRMTVSYRTDINAVDTLTDGTGNEYRFTYTDGRLTKIKCFNSSDEAVLIGGVPLETTFSYNGAFLTGITFPDGKTVSYAYDGAGRLIKAVNIDMNKVELTYAENGTVQSLASYVYDASTESYLTENSVTVSVTESGAHVFTDNFGHFQTKTFDEDGNIETITDENGDYLYGAPDPEEPPTEETTEEAPEPDSVCPCENCEEAACPCECESEEACTCISCMRRSFNETDDRGNVISEKSFDGVKTLTKSLNVYNSSNKLASSSDSAGNTVYYTYDSNGILSAVGAGDTQANFSYDAMGNLKSFAQNVSGLSSGTSMQNIYDYNNDKLTKITHNGFDYNFVYDVWGNQTSVSVGSTVLSQNTYGTGENRSRLSRTEFANGQSIEYAYTPDGKVSAVYVDGGETSRYAYSYSEDGEITSITDNGAGIKTVYTDSGTEYRSLSDNSLIYSLTEDENGHSVQNLFGAAVTYTDGSAYDSLTGVSQSTRDFSRQRTVVDEDTGETNSFSAALSFGVTKDWFGRVTSKSGTGNSNVNGDLFNAQFSQSFTYNDTADTASTRVNAHEFSLTVGGKSYTAEDNYEYDARGNITGIFRMADGVKTYSGRYAYDEAGQLVREDNRRAGKTYVYVYDIGGNIVSKTEYDYTDGDITAEMTPTDTKTFGYSHGTWNDVLTSYNGVPVAYDAMGNITSFGGDTYEWTAGRQLKKMTESGGDFFLYYYNESGFLLRYEAYAADGAYKGEISYCWDGDRLLGYKIVEEPDDDEPNGTEIPVRIMYDSDGEAVGFLLADSAPVYYGKNLQGDITALYDHEGNYIVGYIYDAYGNIVNFDIPTDESLSTGEQIGKMVVAFFYASFNPLSYRGYLYAPAIGLSYYLGSRFYCPAICRFLNADVYADTGTGAAGTNMFAYCNNNPVMYVDPDGFRTIENVDTDHLYFYASAVGRYISNLNKMKDYSGIIDDQDDEPVASLMYGKKTMSYNGCELIAIYNAIFLYGGEPSLPAIALSEEVTLGGIWAYGYFGTYPTFAKNYLKHVGIETETYLTAKSADKVKKAGDIFIVTFSNRSKSLKNIFSLHTVAVQILANGKVRAYNASRKEYDSIYSMAKTSSGWLTVKCYKLLK